MELVRVYRDIRNRVHLGEDQGTLADMLLAACVVLERNKLLAEVPFELVAWRLRQPTEEEIQNFVEPIIAAVADQLSEPNASQVVEVLALAVQTVLRDMLRCGEPWEKVESLAEMVIDHVRESAPAEMRAHRDRSGGRPMNARFEWNGKEWLVTVGEVTRTLDEWVELEPDIEWLADESPTLH